MTFGFPAYHRRQEQFSSADEILRTLARDAMEALGWRVEREDAEGKLSAHVSFNVWSRGEVVDVEVLDGTVTIVSRCRGTLQSFDWGKNQRNVELFLERMPLPVLKFLDAARPPSGAPFGAASTPTKTSRQ